MNRASIKATSEKNHKNFLNEDSLKPSQSITCLRCGGNGYMKSSPICYHTCLYCLGRGSISRNNLVE